MTCLALKKIKLSHFLEFSAFHGFSKWLIRFPLVIEWLGLKILDFNACEYNITVDNIKVTIAIAILMKGISLKKKVRGEL